MIKKIVNRKGEIFDVLIDDEFESEFDKYTWYVSNGYIVTKTRKLNSKQITLRFHRLIMGITDPKIFIDHINLNKLDNRSCNLRTCTPQQNKCNRKSTKNSASRFKGVSFQYRKNKILITSQIRFNNKRIHLGTFKTEEEAARAYDSKAKELFGEFAYLNFPEQISTYTF